MKKGTKVTYKRKPYTVDQVNGKALTLVNKDRTEFVGVHASSPDLKEITNG